MPVSSEQSRTGADHLGFLAGYLGTRPQMMGSRRGLLHRLDRGDAEAGQGRRRNSTSCCAARSSSWGGGPGGRRDKERREKTRW